MLRRVAITAVLALSGCSVAANYQDAVHASDAFHLQADREEYDAIYNTATDEFRAAAGLPQFAGFLQRIHRKMGACGAAPATLVRYQASTKGTFVITTAVRPCVNGKLSEQFTWRITDGKATLLGYTANNPLLLTD